MVGTGFGMLATRKGRPNDYDAVVLDAKRNRLFLWCTVRNDRSGMGCVEESSVWGRCRITSDCSLMRGAMAFNCSDLSRYRPVPMVA